MLRAAFATLLLLSAATPALAEDIVLNIDNRSSTYIDSFNVYPLRDDGSVIDDNLGGLIDDVPAGGQATLALSLTACGLVQVYVQLGNGENLETALDTCTSRDIFVSD